MDIDKHSLDMLKLLLFEETFEHICEEMTEPNRNIVADVLKQLIIKDLVKIFELRGDRFISVGYLEPDAFKGQYFRITSKGIRLLENLKRG
jgi:predicted transcriptional regulator